MNEPVAGLAPGTDRPRLTDDEMWFLKNWARAYVDGRWILCVIFRGIVAAGTIAGAATAVYFAIKNIILVK